MKKNHKGLFDLNFFDNFMLLPREDQKDFFKVAILY